MTRLLPTTPADELFGGWCDVLTASALGERPADPPRLVSDHLALARQLLEPGGSRDGSHVAAVQDGSVVGALRVILPTQDNTSLAVVDLAVHPGVRRAGVGTLLLAESLRLAARAGRTELISEVDEPQVDEPHVDEPHVDDTAAAAPGRSFALRHGWTCDLLETRRDLLLPVDEHRLAALEADARAHSTGYSVVTWRDRTPQELVDDRALLERRMTTDAPHGDLPVEEEEWDEARVREYEQMHVDRGRTVLSAGAVRDGRMVAFTDLQVPLADPRRAHQGGTLVLREHRGHRLGALVKAAVLRTLAADLPAVQRISTFNSETNTPMVAVNEALGFVPAGQLSTWATRR